MPDRTYTPAEFRTRGAAVKAAYRLQDAGHAATVVSYLGRYAAIDLDRTVVEIEEALVDLGFGSEAAKTEAWRLIRRGY